MSNKTIHTALGAPGTGKTKKLISNVATILNSGEKILLAVPTTLLAEEIFSNLPNNHTTIRIDYKSGLPTNTVRALNESLMPDSGKNFIICQHETLHKCDKTHLKDWLIFIDETPTPLKLTDYTFEVNQIYRLELAAEVNGRLKIIPDKIGKLQSEIQTSCSTHGDLSTKVSSTLSKQALEIYKALDEGHTVFIDPPDSANRRTIRVIEERNFFEILESAKAAVILTATLNDGIFDYYAKLHGFTYKESPFTPKQRTTYPKVTIYPMLANNESFSKNIANSDTTIDGTKIKSIQAMTRKISAITENETCLMFTHDWAKSDYGKNFVICNIDSRGINSLQYARFAFTAFHGNPTPFQRRSLAHLAKQHGTSLDILLKCWKTTKKYEMTVQNIFRTGIRNPARENEFCFFVQDHETVQYLTNNFFPEAIIDYQLSHNYGMRKKRGRKPHPMIDKVREMLSNGQSPTLIAKSTGVSRQTVYDEKNRTHQTA